MVQAAVRLNKGRYFWTNKIPLEKKLRLPIPLAKMLALMRRRNPKTDC
jgi:hypothetical protein